MLEFTPPISGRVSLAMREPEDQNILPIESGASEPEEEGYRIHVGRFEGPLDLLLHLVRINEIDIADIPIVEITAQYNEHLELMRELNLEIAGEYLVMAATLMQIKSKMLLPPDPMLGEDEEAEDPRAALAQQLLEYQRFKQAAETLQAMDSRRSMIWGREGIPEEFEGEELLAADLFDLLKSFRELLGRLGEDARLEIMRDTVSIAEKITWLTDLLESRSSVELLALLEDLPSRLERIATFLAVLEMVRLRLAVAYQRKMFGEIRLTACSDEPEAEEPRGEEA
jgi:segregation and condensation protein A